MHDLRVDYIELSVADVAAAKQFYGAVFGWTYQDYGPDYASFFDGRLYGGFRKAEAGGGPGGPLVIMYAVDLEAARERVLEAGGEVVQDIFSFPGGRRFHFSDPAGNVLAVWTEEGAE